MSQPLALPADLDRRQVWAARFLLGISVVFGSLAWLGVWFQMTFFVPRTAELFGSFHMRMPYLTEMVMDQFWFLIPAVAVITLLVCLGIRKRWAWNFSLIVLPLLLNVLVLVSLYLPTLELALGLQWLTANQ